MATPAAVMWPPRHPGPEQPRRGGRHRRRSTPGPARRVLGIIAAAAMLLGLLLLGLLDADAVMPR